MAKARLLSPKKKKPIDQDLFETFALETGFWVLVNGQITDNSSDGFRTQEDVKMAFDAWKKSKEGK